MNDRDNEQGSTSRNAAPTIADVLLGRKVPLWARFVLPPIFFAGAYVAVVLCAPLLIFTFLGGWEAGVYLMAALAVAAILMFLSACNVIISGRSNWALLGGACLLPTLGLWTYALWLFPPHQARPVQLQQGQKLVKPPPPSPPHPTAP